jgi:hypothetical protein
MERNKVYGQFMYKSMYKLGILGTTEFKVEKPRLQRRTVVRQLEGQIPKYIILYYG